MGQKFAIVIAVTIPCAVSAQNSYPQTVGCPAESTNNIAVKIAVFKRSCPTSTMRMMIMPLITPIVHHIAIVELTLVQDENE